MINFNTFFSNSIIHILLCQCVLEVILLEGLHHYDYVLELELGFLCELTLVVNKFLANLLWVEAKRLFQVCVHTKDFVYGFYLVFFLNNFIN